MQRMQAKSSRRIGTAVLTAARGFISVFALAGCMDQSSTAPDVSAAATVEGRAHLLSGSLAITVTATGVKAIPVAVTGPDGFVRIVAATTTLSGIPVGSYRITALSGILPNAIVSTVDVGTVTGSPATVTAGATATASVAFAPQPGTGGLWAVEGQNSTATAVEFTAAQLLSSGTPTPAVTLSGPGTITSAGLAAFDANGNLWLEDSTAIRKYPVAELAASGSPTAAVAITGSYLPQGGNFGGMAFDHGGNLWVSGIQLSTGVGFLIKYTPAQLAAGGNIAPAVVLTPSDSNAVQGLAFDASDNLWLVGYTPALTNSTLMKITPAERAASGTLSAADTLVLPIVQPATAFTPALDATGNLWVTVFSATGGGNLMEVSRTQLTKKGSVTPVITITLPGAIFYPWTLVFDNSGDAWISDDSGINGIVELTPAQLRTSGTPTPKVIIGAGIYWSPLAFDPHAADLPLAVVEETRRGARAPGDRASVPRQRARSSESL
jgi:hypothetical protein